MDSQQNGHQAPANETALERVMRLAAEQHIESLVPWRLRMQTCQVPCEAPAHEWKDGCLRVLTMGDNAWTLV